jgi:Sporulation and spore germination
MTRRFLSYAALAAAAILGIWLLFVLLPRRFDPRPDPASTPPTASTPASSEPIRKIKARLFYVSPDGLGLVAAEQDVAFGEGTLEQGRRLIEAQLAPAAEPLISAVPAGTKLRDLYVAANGEAFVDLSAEVSRAHPGGSLTELLTIYTIVDVLTENLPAVTSVQILIEGKESDTLAGHVDLRRPLTRSLRWTQPVQEGVPQQSTAGQIP